MISHRAMSWPHKKNSLVLTCAPSLIKAHKTQGMHAVPAGLAKVAAGTQGQHELKKKEPSQQRGHRRA